MTKEVKARLEALGITLKQPSKPTGNYVNCVKTGNLLHICGHNPYKADGSMITGKLGRDLTIDEGYQAAKLCGISILGTLEHEIDGDWSRVTRIVKVVGFVNCVEDFVNHPAVINGASDLFVDVFGSDVGRHARSAVGMISLPFAIATEVECIVEIDG